MDNPEKLATLSTQYTGRRKITKNKQTTIQQYTQTNTNNVNNTWGILQTTGGKDEPNIVLCGIYYYNCHYETTFMILAFQTQALVSFKKCMPPPTSACGFKQNNKNRSK